MEPPASAPIAVGHLVSGGAWVGLRVIAAGYEIVIGTDEIVGSAAPAVVDDVLAVAHAYFSEALDPPPPALEATHADMAAAVRWLADHADAAEPEQHRRLGDALDAIDDGLALDEVLARLAAAMAVDVGEDVVAYLVQRADQMRLIG